MTDGKGRILFGVCTNDFNDFAMMKELGYDYAEMGVACAMEPSKTDAEWLPTKERIRGIREQMMMTIATPSGIEILRIFGMISEAFIEKNTLMKAEMIVILNT